MARAKVRLDLDKEGIAKFLKSDELGDEVESVARRTLQARAQSAAGSGAEFDVRRFMGRDRVRVHVGTANLAARQAEARDRVLLMALRGGGRS